jgi:hypothetical protein
VPFTELRRWRLALGSLLASLAACSPPRPPASATAPSVPAGTPQAPAVTPHKVPQGLAPATPARDWASFRRQAALRMVAANPEHSYTGAVPEILLAIPVLEIELNGDGSVRHVSVMRHPTQAPETVQIAIDAVRHAAPYGDMHHLSKPWKFAEVFLFNDDRRFKPRTLDE